MSSAPEYIVPEDIDLARLISDDRLTCCRKTTRIDKILTIQPDGGRGDTGCYHLRHLVSQPCPASSATGQCLAFDLRRVPNPPKHIRDQYDGRSKRLREHQAVFVDMLERAVEDIARAIERGMFSDSRSGDAPTSSAHVSYDNNEANPDATNFSGDSSGESVAFGRTYGPKTVSDSGGEGSLVPGHGNISREHESALQEDPLTESGEAVSEDCVGEPPKSGLTLRISCRCERGRHRSVAFAEELGRRLAQMPATGAVQVGVRVQHRDVEVKSRDSGRTRRGGRGQSRVLGAAIVADQEELRDL